MNEQNVAMRGLPRASFALAEMSTGVAAMTWFACILALALPTTIFFAAPEVWMSLLLGAIIWSTYIFVWVFYRPSRFEICDDGLRIVWPVRSLLIPAADITEFAPISKSDLGLVIRTCGAGGLWGGFGRFWSRKMGRMLIYASRGDALVCIRRGEKRTLLISPEKPEEFIDELRKICGPREGS
jgi:hypothetical protein